MEPDSLPGDATGDALRRVMADGSDLTKPMVLDFQLDVPSEKAGSIIAEKARPLGFIVKVYEDEGAWTVECSRTMVATHAAITRIEEQLDEIARPHGGYSDGWGTFGNCELRDVMHFFRFRTRPLADPQSEEDDAGAFVLCWIQSSVCQVAETRARELVEGSGWIVDALEHACTVSQEDYGDESSEGGREYYEQACIDGEAIVVHSWPLSGDDVR